MMTHTWEAPPGLGSGPLTVLTALRKLDQSLVPAWVQMQDELAALSSDSEHITAPEVGHYMHRDNPDLVIQAIRDLVRRWREGTHHPNLKQRPAVRGQLRDQDRGLLHARAASQWVTISRLSSWR